MTCSDDGGAFGAVGHSTWAYSQLQLAVIFLVECEGARAPQKFGLRTCYIGRGRGPVTTLDDYTTHHAGGVLRLRAAGLLGFQSNLSFSVRQIAMGPPRSSLVVALGLPKRWPRVVQVAPEPIAAGHVRRLGARRGLGVKLQRVYNTAHGSQVTEYDSRLESQRWYLRHPDEPSFHKHVGVLPESLHKLAAALKQPPAPTTSGPPIIGGVRKWPLVVYRALGVCSLVESK